MQQLPHTTESVIPEPVVPDLKPDVHILDYLALVARHKWVAIALVLISGGVFLAATYVMPYTFEAETRILPPDRLSSSGLLSGLNAGYALKILKEVENPSVDLLQNILESRAVAECLAQDSLIARHYHDDSGSHDDVISAIEQALVVLPNFSKVDVKASVSTPWFSTAQEKEEARQLSARLANLAIHAMDSLFLREIKNDAHIQLLYAESEYASRKADLDSFSMVQERFEQEHGIVQLKTQTIAAIEQIAQLRADQDEAAIEANALSREFTERGSARAKATARASAASAVLQQYQRSSEIGPAFNEMPEVNRVYANLLLRRAALEPVVTYLNREVEQQKINQEREKSIITILDLARTPDVRSSPKRLPMLLLGLTAGAALTILYLGYISMMGLAVRSTAASRPPTRSGAIYFDRHLSS